MTLPVAAPVPRRTEFRTEPAAPVAKSRFISRRGFGLLLVIGFSALVWALVAWAAGAMLQWFDY